MGPQTAPAPRRKTSKARRDLQATIAQIDTLFPALADKPSKQADILCEKASTIKTLITLEAEEREAEQDIRIKELEAGHEADSRRIPELTQQNAGLQVAASTREVVTVSDPNHAAVKEERGVLQSIVALLAATLAEDARAETAVKVSQSCSSPRAVETFCRLVGVDYGALTRYTTSSESDLRRSQTARDSNGVIVRAVLAVNYAAPVKPQEPAVFIPDTRSCPPEQQKPAQRDRWENHTTGRIWHQSGQTLAGGEGFRLAETNRTAAQGEVTGLTQSGLVVFVQLRRLQPAPHSKAKDTVCVNANSIPGSAAQQPPPRLLHPRQLDRSEPFTRYPKPIPISKPHFSTSSY